VSATPEELMTAMVDLSYELGYEQVSIERILARAGARQKDFDAVFSSKEECAIAVLEELANSNLRVVREAYEREAVWPDSLRAGAYAAARWIIENPRKVRFGILEMLWASELTIAWRGSFFRNYLDMIDAGREVAKDPDEIPEYTAEATIGSITELVAKNVRRGSGADPREFIPELMYLAVRPYLGEEAAARELTIRSPPRGPR
jgi:AcrR family transcriptional regulator